MSHELVEHRKPYSKTWQLDDGKRQFVSVLGTRLHNDDGSESSFELQRVVSSQLDGWRVLVNDVHYALGRPGDKPSDGWFGYGGRRGQYWLKWRLLRVGYLHWPTRTWQDVGGAPTYDRSKLSRDVSSVTLGPSGAERTINVVSSATWEDIWSVAGKGIDIRWRMEGRKLKEEIVIPQDARDWIASNRPPTTPTSNTWFGFVFHIDPSDIPKWWQAGQLLDINGDNSDDAGAIELRNAVDDVLAVMPISQAFSELYVVGVDENGNPVYEQDTVRLRKRIWKDGDNYWLLVGARVDHLNSLHEGDIVFDPTFETQPDAAAGIDTFLDENGHTNDNKALDHLGLSGSATPWRLHGLIKHDVSDISGNTVESAIETLTLTVQSGDNRDYEWYNLLVANDGWVEGANWDYAQPSTVRWEGDSGEDAGSDAGCSVSTTDYSATVLAAETVAWDVAAETAVEFTLTVSQVQAWVDGSNYGFLLRTTAGGGTWERWASSDHATAAFRPKLTIEYASGAVQVTPAAVTAVGVTVNPTVVLGSISLTPTAAFGIGAVVAPGVIHGSLSLTPTAAAGIGAVVAPGVGMSSMSVAPAAATAVGAVAAPGVVQSSLNIAPVAAVAVGVAVDPAVTVVTVSRADGPRSMKGLIGGRIIHGND